jgi:hypothetical protein
VVDDLQQMGSVFEVRREGLDCRLEPMVHKTRESFCRATNSRDDRAARGVGAVLVYFGEVVEQGCSDFVDVYYCPFMTLGIDVFVVVKLVHKFVGAPGDV